MAEKFNATIQRKKDIENAIAIIANCIAMFKPLKEGKEKYQEIDIRIANLEKDMDTMKKSFEQYESGEAKSVLDSGCATLRCLWEELLPQRNELRSKVGNFEENIKEYLLYSESFTYMDDELLKWLLSKATKESVEYTEFFAILIIIRKCYNGDNYKNIVKMYAYNAKDQYIIENLLELDINKFCNYIACAKI